MKRLSQTQRMFSYIFECHLWANVSAELEALLNTVFQLFEALCDFEAFNRQVFHCDRFIHNDLVHSLAHMPHYLYRNSFVTGWKLAQIHWNAIHAFKETCCGLNTICCVVINISSSIFSQTSHVTTAFPPFNSLSADVIVWWKLENRVVCSNVWFVFSAF